MNGQAEGIAGNTPLTSKTRPYQRRGATGPGPSKLSQELQRQASSSSSSDGSSIAGSEMQQRALARNRDALELDEMEEGQNVRSALLVQNGGSHTHTGISAANEKGKLKLDGDVTDDAISSTGLTDKDKRAMVLLVALYLLQGIPVGLAFGSIPYLLRSKLSYSQIGIFTLCTYPYSLKLLWSPVVDSIFSHRIGRRKSWIIPIQYIVGCMLWWLSRNIDTYMDKVSSLVYSSKHRAEASNRKSRTFVLLPFCSSPSSSLQRLRVGDYAGSSLRMLTCKPQT